MTGSNLGMNHSGDSAWRPDHILVDASCLINRRAGVGHYAANSVEGLIAMLPDTEFHIFLGGRWARSIPEAAARTSDTAKLRAGLIGIVRRSPVADRLWRLYCRWRFTPKVGFLRPEVIYAPNYMAPANFDNVVPVVYDLAHLRLPGVHPGGRRVWLDGLSKALEHAPAIVTISEFSKREIVELMGVAPEKIFIAPPGVGTAFRPPPQTERVEVLERHGLVAGRYFLAIGSLEPRKNLKLLIEAYSRLPPRLRDSHALVLGGGGGWGDAGLSGNLAQGLRRGGQLRLLGYVPDGDLPALYSGATAFCFPSLYEGFGMPVVEAMACEAPVLASNAASVPEAAGDAGFLLDPHDAEAWTEALRRIVEDEDLAARLRALGPDQAAKFTWEGCAESILAAFRHAVSA